MLARREWTRFFRQRNRVIGGLGQPILFWLLFGTGMHQSFASAEGGDFMSYYLPGTIALILLFTAIFTTISIIEDRKEGFLQNVLVAPVPRWTIAMGKITGGAAIAWVQAVIFVGLALVVGSLPLSWQLVPLLIVMAGAAIGMTALGVVFAWPMDSTQGFHAIMNLVLMPLWLLSGAFFPVPAVTGESPVGQHVMHWIMRCNPISYVIALMRDATSAGASVLESAELSSGGSQLAAETVSLAQASWAPNPILSWAVLLAFVVLGCFFATRQVMRPIRSDLK